MKTLDEVIKAFEQCKDDKCYGCAYHEKVHANSCIAKRNSDALIYLNAYQWQMTNPDGDHLQLEKCRALLSDFYRNDPLSWDELRTMEGKPVWVEYGIDFNQKRWVVIHSFHNSGFCYMNVSGNYPNTFWQKDMGEDEYWQAYRMERK